MNIKEIARRLNLTEDQLIKKEIRFYKDRLKDINHNKEHNHFNRYSRGLELWKSIKRGEK